MSGNYSQNADKIDVRYVTHLARLHLTEHHGLLLRVDVAILPGESSGSSSSLHMTGATGTVGWVLYF